MKVEKMGVLVEITGSLTYQLYFGNKVASLILALPYYFSCLKKQSQLINLSM